MAFSSGKGVKHGRKGSTPSYDTNRFRSEANCNFFKANMAKCQIISDISFVIEDNVYPEIVDNIENRGWSEFVKVTGRGFQNLTYEFYSNGWKDKKDEERPKNMSYEFYSSDAINEVLETVRENMMDDTEFVRFSSEPLDYNRVLETLCRPGADRGYDASANAAPKMLRIADLKPIPRIWCSFMLGSFLPLINETELVIERVKLLYTIVTGIEVDVGDFITPRIETIVMHKSASLGYPSVITLLCLRAGVALDDMDVPIRPKVSITAARIEEMEGLYGRRRGAAPQGAQRQPRRKRRLTTRENFELAFEWQDVMQRNIQLGMRGLAQQIQRVALGGFPLPIEQAMQLLDFEDLPNIPGGNIPEQDEEEDEDDAETEVEEVEEDEEN